MEKERDIKGTSQIKVSIFSPIDDFEELKKELLKNPIIKEVWLDRIVYKNQAD